MARLLKFVSSQQEDAPFVRSFLNTVGGFSGPPDDNLLKSSMAYTMAATPVPPADPSEAASMAALFPLAFQNVSSLITTETSENLFVPVYRRKRFVLGYLYGESFPNAMVLRLLSLSRESPASVQVARRFVVDLDQSPDSLELLEYEWFSDGKLIVSMHTIDLDGEYGGTSIVLQCDDEVIGGDETTDMGQAELSVVMRLKFSEFRDCAVCKGPRSACPCGGPSDSRVSLPVPGSGERLSWTKWLSALAATRDDATSTMVVNVSAAAPMGEMTSRVRFRTHHISQLGAESGLAMLRRLSEQVQRKLVPPFGVFDTVDVGLRLDGSTIVEGMVGDVAEDLISPEVPNAIGHVLPVAVGSGDEAASVDESSPHSEEGDGAGGRNQELNAVSGMQRTTTSEPKATVGCEADVAPRVADAFSTMSSTEVLAVGSYSQHPTSGSMKHNEWGKSSLANSSCGVQKKAFPCDSCDAIFHHRGHLNVHVMARHLNLRPYKCPSCPASFTKRSDLKRHVLALHRISLQNDTVDISAKPFGCSDCDKRFATRQGLGKHVSRKHDVDGGGK